MANKKKVGLTPLKKLKAELAAEKTVSADLLENLKEAAAQLDEAKAGLKAEKVFSAELADKLKAAAEKQKALEESVKNYQDVGKRWRVQFDETLAKQIEARNRVDYLTPRLFAWRLLALLSLAGLVLSVAFSLIG